MKQQPKQDLRYIKNENLIRETFRKMICEMDYSKISIKELTQRAQINRKTFYLHYSSLDHLLAILQLEIMASLDWTDRKILATKGDFPEKKGPSDLILDQLFQKYDHLAQYGSFESSLILTYFSVCLGVIFRQWEANSQKTPMEEMVHLTTKLILHGLDGVGLTPEKKDLSH